MKIFDFLTTLLADKAPDRRSGKGGTAPYGFKGLMAVVRDHFSRFTLYNPLALIAGITFTGSLFMPWWQAKVYENYYTINAYAFILDHNLPPEGLPYIIETPIIAVILLVCMLAGYFFLIFWGSTMKGRKGKLFLLWSGIFMLLYAAGFYGSLLFATHRIGQPITGYSSIVYSVEVDIYMYFTRAYAYAIGSGIAVILSALIHGRFPIRLHGKESPANDEP
jgi:hypothetical protein